MKFDELYTQMRVFETTNDDVAVTDVPTAISSLSTVNCQLSTI